MGWWLGGAGGGGGRSGEQRGTVSVVLPKLHSYLHCNLCFVIVRCAPTHGPKVQRHSLFMSVIPRFMSTRRFAFKPSDPGMFTPADYLNQRRVQDCLCTRQVQITNAVLTTVGLVV